MIKVNKNPKELMDAKRAACYDYGNIERQDGTLELISPLRNALIKQMPPAVCLMDWLAERLESVVLMWQLGDLESHYKHIVIENCEPFGISIGIINGHRFMNGVYQRGQYSGAGAYKHTIVIPTHTLFFNMEGETERIIGRLMEECCKPYGCFEDRDSGK